MTDPTALAVALAGLEAAVRERPGSDGPSLDYHGRRRSWEALMRLAAPLGRYGLPAGPSTIARGYGSSILGALVDLWDGEFGVWRLLDSEDWREAHYPRKAAR